MCQVFTNQRRCTKAWLTVGLISFLLLQSKAKLCKQSVTYGVSFVSKALPTVLALLSFAYKSEICKQNQEPPAVQSSALQHLARARTCNTVGEVKGNGGDCSQS